MSTYDLEAERTRLALAEVKATNYKLQLLAEFFDRSLSCHWSDERDASAKDALKTLGEIDSKMSHIQAILLDRIDSVQ